MRAEVPKPMGQRRRQAFAVINMSSAPVWLAMIIAPSSSLTRWLVARTGVLFLSLGVAYDGLLAAGMISARHPLDFQNPDALRAALGEPDTFLAGWAHYIAFDLFVGRWIWEDSLKRQSSARMAMVLTWMAGPAGLSLYLAQRDRT